MLSGREAEALEKGAVSECCSCFLGARGYAEILEGVREKDGVRSGGTTFEEEEVSEVTAWLKSEVEPQRSTGGANDEGEEDTKLIVVERGSKRK